ncbi:uncharacterized protein V6R79_017170 [Siganus canaliculatus]
MDQSSRGPDVLQRRLRVLNQKEDRELQRKLNMLDKQYRYTHKMLQQRRELLLKEQRRIVTVKVCEPKATLSIAMKEIEECRNTEKHLTGISGRRSYSSKPQHLNMASELDKQSRSLSAPPESVKPTGAVRHRGNVQSSLSIIQMKNIASIDSISEKELIRQQQKVQEDMERQRQQLHKRVAAFIEKLKHNMEIHKEFLYKE